MGNEYTYDRFDVPLIDGSQTPEQMAKGAKFGGCDGAQNPSQCKKRTPNYMDGNPKKGKEQVGFKVGDKLTLINVKSLVQGIVINGDYKFDSYDAYDNTCYVITDRSSMTYNVLLSEIKITKKK